MGWEESVEDPSFSTELNLKRPAKWMGEACSYNLAICRGQSPVTVGSQCMVELGWYTFRGCESLASCHKVQSQIGLGCWLSPSSPKTSQLSPYNEITGIKTCKNQWQHGDRHRSNSIQICRKLNRFHTSHIAAWKHIEQWMNNPSTQTCQVQAEGHPWMYFTNSLHSLEE